MAEALKQYAQKCDAPWRCPTSRNGKPPQREEIIENATGDNIAKTISGKLSAQNLWRDRASDREIVSKTNFRPLERVVACHNSEARSEKRPNAARELLDTRAGGMRAKCIYWCDETQAEETLARDLTREIAVSATAALPGKIP